MEKQYDDVFRFLSQKQYPAGYAKARRHNLRKLCKKFTLKDGELFVRHRRVVRSQAEARALFWEFHAPPGAGHLGIMKTRTALSSRFYWKGMTIDIENWVVDCDKSQKVHRPPPTPLLRELTEVTGVWQLVGIDLMGPLPKTESGAQYILITTDYYSKWVEAFPLKTGSPEEAAPHICSMIYRYGCPKRLLCDRGPEFTQQLNFSLQSLLRARRSAEVTHHPLTNRLDEKTQTSITSTFMKLVTENPGGWEEKLDAALLRLRSKVNNTTKYSPFYLMFRREAVQPSEVPVNLKIGSLHLPDEKNYETFLEESQNEMESVSRATLEALANTQRRKQTGTVCRTQGECAGE